MIDKKERAYIESDQTRNRLCFVITTFITFNIYVAQGSILIGLYIFN